MLCSRGMRRSHAGLQKGGGQNHDALSCRTGTRLLPVMRDTNAHVVVRRTRGVEAGVGAALRPRAFMQKLCHRLWQAGGQGRGGCLPGSPRGNAPRGQGQREAFSVWQCAGHGPPAVRAGAGPAVQAQAAHQKGVCRAGRRCAPALAARRFDLQPLALRCGSRLEQQAHGNQEHHGQGGDDHQ